ncbi:DUF2000 family protein [Nocardia terpenica]|uniref:Uncharacterized protein n=1 Tax=Nocardia terpenica TaxID=455432 RepID=A0A164M2B6_9NOCA|nr:DUF2000 family protein [Nocardia terpenica]KZM72962.1 hypothetical protein AWN90_29915 [Nocardia terpenica]
MFEESARPRVVREYRRAGWLAVGAAMLQANSVALVVTSVPGWVAGVLVAVSISAAVAMVWWARRAREPLVDPALLHPAAVRAVPTTALDLVGLAVYGPRNAVDKIMKGARMHP